MTEFNLYLIILCALVAVFCAMGVWRFVARSSARRGENRFVDSVITDAVRQKASVDLKLLEEGMRAGLSAALVARSKKGLVVQSSAAVGDGWRGKPVEAYFRVQHDEGPVFFVFESTVLELRSGADRMQMELALPQHLRVEQKRHFVRAHPDIKDIMMVAVWPAAPGKRLPRVTADLGQPAASYKSGQEHPTVLVENISGSGMALRFSGHVCDDMPIDCDKGRQIICLLAYRPDADAAKPVVFWCSAEIMNSRRSGQAISLGLEFTNWAVQEQGDSEIHWMHNSPWRGVRPILQWVQRIEKAKNLNGG